MIERDPETDLPLVRDLPRGIGRELIEVMREAAAEASGRQVRRNSRSREDTRWMLGTVILVSPLTVVPDSVVAAGSYSSMIVADLPYVYYRLGEASGATAADSSGNALDSTYSGGVVYGRPGAVPDANTAIGSSAAGQAARTTLVSVTAPYTCEWWWKGSAGGITHVGLGATAGAFPRFSALYTGGALAQALIYLNSSNYRYGAIYPVDSLWHHAVMTVRGTAIGDIANARIWRDGREDTYPTTVAVDSPTAPSGGIVVGNMPAGNELDEVAAYDYELSPAQVAAHYTRGAAGRLAGLKRLGAYSSPALNDRVLCVWWRDAGSWVVLDKIV